MKYYTKELYGLNNNAFNQRSLKVTKAAETYSEEYFSKLYDKRLKGYLRMYKKASEVSAEDIFIEGCWDSISVVNEKGEFVDAATFLPAEELQKLREGIRRSEQEAKDNFVPVVYDEEALTKQYHDNIYLIKLKQLEDNLPEDILRDIADIRVFALDKASNNIKKRVKRFCRQKEEQLSYVWQDYLDYYQNICTQLPEKLQKNYGFHDCKVLHYEQSGTDVMVEIDHSGGYSDVCKIIYHNADVLEQEDIVGSYWIYDEIYITGEFYEFHALLQDSIGIVRYFTIKAADVDFIKDIG